MPFRLSEADSSPALFQVENLVSKKRRPPSFERIVSASFEDRHPWSTSVKTTPTRTARAARMRPRNAVRAGSWPPLKYSIQTDVSAMTTPAPRAFRLGLQLPLF